MDALEKPPYRIGLTGGIASGKSMVATYFQDLGVSVVDTDVIARDVVAPDSAALATIREVFGNHLIAADGSLNRKEMRRVVFEDDDTRQKLENILHPLIRESALAQADAAESPYVIVVVPLLYESPLREVMDRVLVVDCREDTQLRRLKKRDSESIEQAKRMIAAQSTRAERLSIADDVISNDGTPEEALAEVKRLHVAYLRLAKEYLPDHCR